MLMGVLQNSVQKNLSVLDLSLNPTWWNNKEASEVLLFIIESQANMHTLRISHCTFKNAMITERLFGSLCSSCSISKLQRVMLNGSVDFTSDQSCQMLVQFINIATKLNNLDISEQKHSSRAVNLLCTCCLLAVRCVTWSYLVLLCVTW